MPVILRRLSANVSRCRNLPAALLILLLLATTSANAAEGVVPRHTDSLLESLLRFNTQVVLLGTLLLGASSGIVGTFMLLRRQALVGDVVSHAALPGVGGAFLIGELLHPGSGRSLGWLLTGAAVSGLLAIGTVNLLRRFTSVKPDAILATVLGVFFGLGAVLLKAVQELPTGNQAGLQSFILGSAATMRTEDVTLIAKAALLIPILCLLLYKELRLICFDEDYATVQGWPVLVLDVGLTVMVVAVTVIGLQTVGLLMVAMLITPPTAARFWTSRLGRMTLIAAVIGAGSAVIGTLASSMVPKLAGGPTIVLAASMLFVLSLFFGTEKGLVRRWSHQRSLKKQTGRDDLLRAMFEITEARSRPSAVGVHGAVLEAIPAQGHSAALAATSTETRPVLLEELVRHRSWSAWEVRNLVFEAEHSGMIRMDQTDGWRLTAIGEEAARRAVRSHRLWEMYLILHADISPELVDRDADSIEHLLEPGEIEELEQLVAARRPKASVPPSPHPVDRTDSSSA